MNRNIPRSIRPMLAKASSPFDSDEHLFELKWDGTRCIAFIGKGNLRLQNRRLTDITLRYPEFRRLGNALGADTVLVAVTPDTDYYLNAFMSVVSPYPSWGRISDIAFEARAVPEPASMVLLGIGLVGLVAVRRKLE